MKIFDVELETNYTKKTAREHRKKFAQFFTPEPIANLMTDWILGGEYLREVLEPAFGLGIFSRLLLEKKSNLKVEGFDIDEIIFSNALEYFNKYENVSLNLKDYIYNGWENKYDGIICNPPYLKFHDYENKKIIEEVGSYLNFRLNGFTNLYTLFLLKSVFQLKKGGRMAYIVPSEFLNSDYGGPVKEYLLRTKVLRHLFIVDFKENVFDDAMTTATILLLAKDKHDSSIQLTNIQSKSDLHLIKDYIHSYPNAKGEFSFKTNQLDPDVKWRQYYQIQKSINYKNLVPFLNYAKVVRGIATGANKYFTFRKSKVEKYSIPSENLLPCICRAKDVKGSFFKEIDFERLVEKDELAYLFHGKNSTNKKVSEYILLGEKEKVDEKYLTKKKRPWYLLENRPPAPIWVSVFSRNDIKFIRNEANISNLTSFHCVYPTNSGLFSNVSIDLLFAYLITDVAKEIFSDFRREYGNGLRKFEPNDLNKSKMLDLSILSQKEVKQILRFYQYFRKTEDEEYIKQIDKILRLKFTVSRIHTHTQLS